MCSACHSLQRIPYRSLVGVTHTVDEAKAMAEENEYDTEPNDEGEIEKRPGKLSDYLPSPYKNDEAARAANNGALPPDLSLIIKARHGGVNYVFSLLTGYPEEPPAGAVVQSGLNFNPYFPGTGIAMARVLYDGLVEYEDGTPASASQMAKDVVEFLNWSAEPEMDQRKKMGMKVLIIATALFAISVWVKRYKWSPIKTRKVRGSISWKGFHFENQILNKSTDRLPSSDNWWREALSIFLLFVNINVVVVFKLLTVQRSDWYTSTMEVCRTGKQQLLEIYQI